MFDSANLKVKRAQKHISDLECAFDRFVETHTHTFAFSNDAYTNQPLVEVCFSEAIPLDFSLILGDATHNLRTALDHVAWELSGIDGGAQDRSTAFPFSRTKDEYEATCNGIKTPRDDTKKFFVALEAHEGGAGEILYALNRLDNAEKHTVLTPVIGMARVGEIEVIQPNGETFMRMTNCRFSMGPNGRTRLLDVPAGGYMVKIDQKANLPLEIFFGDVKFFQALPLIETLMELSYSITNIIGQFEQFVLTRK